MEKYCIFMAGGQLIIGILSEADEEHLLIQNACLVEEVAEGSYMFHPLMLPHSLAGPDAPKVLTYVKREAAPMFSTVEKGADLEIVNLYEKNMPTE